MPKQNNLIALRLDKWLWAARFFKTRGIATSAINGGKVHVNNMRVKPAKKIQIGDLLDITKGELAFSVKVIGINDKRRPAKEAVLMYQEDNDSVKVREEKSQFLKEKRVNNKMFAQADKKQKRRVRRIKDDYL